MIRGSSGTVLADALADRLATPLADPLAAEQVVVHSQGIERWLGQHLSGRLGVAVGADGICANVDFPQPLDIVRKAIRAAGGVDPRRSVWAPDRLVWPVMELLVDEPDDADLAGSLAVVRDRIGNGEGRRYGVVRGIAGLLDDYSTHRPDMVLNWLDGRDVDATGKALGDADLWQPRLFRAVRERVGQPTLAESVESAAANMDAPADLPERISMFGFTALPSTYLTMLSSLATHIDIALYVLHPSPTLWARRDGRGVDATGAGMTVLPARADLTLEPPAHRLLRSWGTNVAELQLVAQSVVGDDAAAIDADPPTTVLDEGATVLARLQDDISHDRPVQLGRSAVADESVQIHACHGSTRQVQVLRDEILRLMVADPTLEPRDIVVMCPDVEQFAPLVQAHLAVPTDDPDGRPDLRVRLADRALRQTNPMMRVLEEVLVMTTGRLTLSRLLDLASSEPVSRRFGFTADDLATLRDWAVDSGMRWGLDADDRARAGVDLDANTIDFGLSRLLLGAAMADEDRRVLGGVSPLDDVEGGAVVLAGRLAEFVDRLRAVFASFRSSDPLDIWMPRLARATDLLMQDPWEESWQRTQVMDLLADITDTAARGLDGQPTVPLDVADIRALLAEPLRGQPSRANHRTGDLTVCTLVPMRSVPHRVVCLLGMDDEVFPRRTHARGDDLISRHPRVGDVDGRSEDRQLLLDAVMAAGETLVITYDGVDLRTGRERPPCAPVGELIGVLGAEHVITHPLHAHDPAAFGADRPGFDPQAHAAARALTALPATRAVSQGPGVQRPDSAAGEAGVAELSIARLAAFAIDPVAYFYRHTVGAYVPEDPEAPDQQVPLSLAPLDYWTVGEGFLEQVLAAPAHATGGRPPDVDDDQVAFDLVLDHLRGTGIVPPPPFADRQIQKIQTIAGTIADLMAQRSIPMQAAARVEVELSIGHRRLVGTVDGTARPRRVVTSFSKVKAKTMMAAWVNHLALTLQSPHTPWESWVVGRHEEKKSRGLSLPHAAVFGSLGETADQRTDVATGFLTDLLDVHDLALTQPLVVPASSAAAYAIQRVLLRQSADQADDAAAVTWDHDDFGYGKDADRPAHVLLFGDSVPYEVMTAREQAGNTDGSRPGEEPHLFGALAVRLWEPLLRNCKAAGP